MNKIMREILDRHNQRLIDTWKSELQNPNLSKDHVEAILSLIKCMEKEFKYTYTSVKLKYNTIVIKHKRTEPRGLILEEEDLFFLHRWWRKLAIWCEWYWNQ